MDIENHHHRDRAEKHKNQGNNYFKKQQYMQAIEEYSKAIDLFPDEPNYYGNRAACYLQTKKYTKCIEDCDSALKLEEKSVKNLRRKFLALQQLGNLEEALHISKQVIQLEDNPANRSESDTIQQLFNCLKKVNEFIQRDSYNEALQNITYLYEQIPNAFIAQVLFIEVLIKVGQLDKANKLLTDFKDSNGQIPQTYYLLGLYEQFTGQNERAKKYYKEATKLDPEHLKAIHAYKLLIKLEEQKDKANQLLNNGKYQEAIDYYGKILTLDPWNKQFNAIIHSNRGLSYQKMNKHTEAIMDFDKAIELNPNYFKAYLRRGDSRTAKKDFDGAQGDYQKVIEIDPSQEANIRPKLRQQQQQQRKAAKKDYYKILEVEKTATDAEIKKAYRKLALQWHPDKQKDGDEEQKKLANIKFREIAEAYDMLSDKKKKQQYDLGSDPNDPTGGFDFGGGMGGMNIDPTEIFARFFSQDSEGMGGFGGMNGMGGIPFMFTNLQQGGGQQRQQQGGFSGGFPGFQFQQFTFKQ